MDHDREYLRLFEPLVVRASGYAWSILQNRADAEDALQEATLKGLDKFQTYDSQKSFKSWWFAIIRNCCIDLRRERQRNRKHLSAVGERTSDPSDSHKPAESRLDLVDALKKLSENHREILRLRYYADCSYKEIAQTLEIPQGTVMSRLHAAREKLLKILREVKR